MQPSHDALAQSRTFKVYNQTIEESADNLSAAPAPLTTGEVLEGKYQVEKLLGRGGMGAVYAATHLQLQKPVAIKALLTRVFDEEAFRRFHREALSLGKFRHKHIVEIFDFGTLKDRPYFAMELLSGVSLAEHIDSRRQLAPAKVIEIFLQVAEALEYAHRLDIIHRDIKPGNIFISLEGATETVKLVDFGLAKLASEGQSSGITDQSATQIGTIFGSPLYMSPEQSSGQAVDRRTDIYSFGCALFEALTGRPPFKESTAVGTIMAHQLQKPPSLKDMAPNLTFSARLEALVGRTLKKKPDERLQDFSAVISELKLIAAAEVGRSAAPVNISPENNRAQPVERKDNESSKKLSWLPAAIILFVATFITLTAAYFISTNPQVNKKREIAPSPDAATKKLASANDTNSGGVNNLEQQSPPEKVTIKIQVTPAVTTLTFSQHRGEAFLVIPGSAQGARPLICRDTIKIASGHRFYLHCSLGISPEFLEQWPADTIEALWLEKGDWTPAHIRALKKQPHLTDLSIRASELLDGSASTLHEITRLKLLDVTDSTIDGAQLAPLSSWPQLTELRAPSITNARSFLNGPSAPSIVSVHLDGDELTDADLGAIIRKFPNLIALSLNSNKIEGDGLATLRNSKIEILNLEFVKTGPECITPLSEMKHLKTLRMPADGLTAVDISRLKKSLPPNCWTITQLTRGKALGL